MPPKRSTRIAGLPKPEYNPRPQRHRGDTGRRVRPPPPPPAFITPQNAPLIQAIIAGASPEFATYVTAVGTRPNPALGYTTTRTLMNAHGTGADWKYAWPSDLYIQRGILFPTRWLNNPPAPVPPTALSITDENWLQGAAALMDAMIPSPTAAVLIAYANQFAVARARATGGIITTPPQYLPGYAPGRYITEVITYMATTGADVLSWQAPGALVPHLANMAADFGAAAAAQLQAAAPGNNLTFEAAGSYGWQGTINREASRIWVAELAARVIAERNGTPYPWFQSQLDSFEKFRKHGRYIQHWPTPAAVTAYISAPGPVTYQPMCAAIGGMISAMIADYRGVVEAWWQTYVPAGATLPERKARWKAYHTMTCHIEAGGWPYLPTKEAETTKAWNDARAVLVIQDPTKIHLPAFDLLKVTARQLSRGGVFVVPPAFTTLAQYVTDVQNAIDRKDIPSFDISWERTIGQEIEQRPNSPGTQLIVQLRTQMTQRVINNNEPAHGYSWGNMLHEWRDLTARAASSLTLSRNTKLRFQDLHSRVLGFSEQFGILLPQIIIDPTAVLTDGLCDAIVIHTQDRMVTKANPVWNSFQNHVYPAPNLAEMVDLNTMVDRRTELLERGTDFPPHAENLPVVLTREDQAAALPFLGTPMGTGGTWNFIHTLGSGSFGHAGLWVQQNNNGAITARRAAKDVYMIEDAQDWNRPERWMGEMHNRVLKEASLQMALSNLANSDNIVEANDFSIHESLRICRVYMEYCQHGSLDDLLRILNAQDIWLPERQLWAIFDGLINAFCLCQLGNVGNTRAANWIPIWHADVKPDNIYLGAPDQTVWPAIPKAKLGDFGLAARSNDPSILWQGRGTRGFRAPEQEDYADSGNPEFIGRAAMVDESDLWAVGKVMLSLINRRAEYVPVRYDAPLPTPMFVPGTGARYSLTLRSEVLRCLREDPDDRRVIGNLYTVIQAHVGAGMNVNPRPANEGLVFWRDAYAMGTVPPARA